LNTGTGRSALDSLPSGNRNDQNAGRVESVAAGSEGAD
jgi:hypothetical protein